MQWDGTSFVSRSGPLLTGAIHETVKGIAATTGSPSEIIAVGTGGTIVKYAGSGTTWTSLVAASTNVYNGIWTSPTATTRWVVGSSGVIMRWQTSSFVADPQSGVLTTHTLEAVWGSGDSDVWAVGDGGIIVHYDGSKWTSVYSSTAANLYGIWGSGAGDMWAVGQGGTILRYQNSSWARWPDQVTANDLYGVWGSGATDVTFVGASGTVLRYSSK